VHYVQHFAGLLAANARSRFLRSIARISPIAAPTTRTMNARLIDERRDRRPIDRRDRRGV